MFRLITLCTSLTLILLLGSGPLQARAAEEPAETRLERMLGEELSYDISFLWFKRMASGRISLAPGPEPGQYTAVLQARTRGFAAFLTGNRVERIETLMERNPDGSFRPLLQKAHTTKSSGGEQQQRVRSYRFDYQTRQVHYENQRTGKPLYKKDYPMGTDGPVYDLLSAFYSVRSGVFGSLAEGRKLALPTFSRRGTDDIVVAAVNGDGKQGFFNADNLLCQVLIDPDIFKTKNGDVFVEFDKAMVPQRAVVKGVVGLGDVRGQLRNISYRPPLAPAKK